MKLVWLFSEYRDLVEKHRTLEFQAEKLADKVVELTKNCKDLTEALESAHAHIQSNPSYLNNVLDLLAKYQQDVLQEVPLAPDAQPEWLTPGEDNR